MKLKQKSSFLPGDLVMVMDASAPQESLMLERVMLPNKQSGLCGSFKDKTGTVNRPVTKMCLINKVSKSRLCIHLDVFF